MLFVLYISLQVVAVGAPKKRAIAVHASMPKSHKARKIKLDFQSAPCTTKMCVMAHLATLSQLVAWCALVSV